MINDSNRNMRTASGLARLDELDDFEIADGEPDIRGWTVKTADGQEVGEVANLIADPAAREVRYIEVKVKHELLGTKADEHVLMPIGIVRLNDDDDVVTVNRLPSTGLRGIPRYGLVPLTAENDRSLADHYYGKNATRDKDEHARFFGARRKGRENANYLTLSEEQLAVGKRATKQGEVDVHKTVETKHVEKEVPTMREVVTVERHPATPGMSAKPTISEEEIRVPVMGEEVVTEKRTVPIEEIVIKKTAVAGTQTVEADLKREKVDVERKGDTAQPNR